MQKISFKLHYRYYALGLLFAVLSSLRVPYLAETQVLLVFLVILLGYKTEQVLLLVISVLCTHVYAIPDAVLREASAVYPSVYTRSYGFIKLLDLLVIVLAIYAFPSFARAIHYNNIKLLAFLLFVCIFALIVNSIFGVSNFNYFLFHLRNFLLVVSIALILPRIEYHRVTTLLIFAMYCWLCKMAWMILLPSDNVLAREIFGIEWKIFFAGDEYLSFALMCAVVLQVSFAYNRHLHYKKICYLLCLAGLIFALIAQRKGAVPYFFMTFLMIFSFGKSRLTNMFFSLTPLLFAFGVFFVSGVLYEYLPAWLKLSLIEYNTLYNSAVASIISLAESAPYSLFFGIGPAGLYEIKDLPVEADHMFSFGQEVGEKYRYAIWTLPFDRLFLTGGVIGAFAVLLFLLINLIKNRTFASFYIALSLIPFFGLYGLTPVSAIFVGFALYVFADYKPLRY